jgi:NADH-quinone oxidoreductase subunit H
MQESLEWLIGPGWLAALLTYIIKATIIVIIAPVMMLLLTWIERRAIAYMQDRIGPNRVGPQGLLQPIADGVKMFTKEDIVPDGADKVIHFLAPVVILFSTIVAFVVMPWGNLYPVDISVSLLFIVAISSVHVLGFLMAGWGSNNKFALLGGMRGVAQLISYEIPQVMSLVVIVMWVGSMSLRDIANHQSGWYGLQWHVFTPIGALAAVIFFIASLAEGERAPFDIPEADSEIVAGHITEYGGMKFGLFYLANYLTNLLICFLTTIIFFGGGYGPGVTPDGGLFSDLLSIVYFLAKGLFFFFFMVWIRGTVPRMRMDQLMSFAWKVLLPLAIANVFSAGLWIAITRWGPDQGMSMEWFVNLGRWERLAIAFVVTALINAAALYGVYAINRSRPDNLDYIDEALLEAA